MNPSLFTELLSRQQVLILVRDNADDFRPAGMMPAWLAAVVSDPVAVDASLKLAAIFPFLDHFLPDAERF